MSRIEKFRMMAYTDPQKALEELPDYLAKQYQLLERQRPRSKQFADVVRSIELGESAVVCANTQLGGRQVVQ